VMEYSHEMAVTDGVNVDFTVYKIETAITKAGATIETGEFAGFRNRQTRKVRWDSVDEPIEYSAAQNTALVPYVRARNSCDRSMCCP
jgi:type I restriction enzyme, R subunit